MRSRRFTGRLLCAVAAASLALTASQPAMAWGKNGHRIVGEIASQYLSPQAKAAVIEILGSEGMAEAANYPDFMRASGDPFWEEKVYPWHWVTVPEGQTYDEVGPPEEGDAVSGIAYFSDILRDPDASLADKQGALRYIIHAVGDLAQPLHNGNGTDRGGNQRQVTWFGKPTNLHSVWDSLMLEDQQLSYSEYAKLLEERLTPEEMRDWANPHPKAWVAEGTALRDTIYPEGDDLSYTYIFAHKAQMEGQLQRGGLRLAAYLNALYAPE